MSYLDMIIRRAAILIKIIGAGGLVLVMLLIVSNIIYRFSGHTIVGTYELVTLIIVIPAACGLGYAALEKTHVTIRVLVSRFPQRAQLILESLTATLSLIILASISWATLVLLSERGLEEKTLVLDFPYLPVKFIWVLGLLFYCLIILLELLKAISKMRER